MLPRRLAIAALAFLLSLTSAVAAGKLTWQSWSSGIFARAKAENRFVILDLEAVWCHWCHVMEETTYKDPKVVEQLETKYLTVRADQDANPDLSSRYGDWGWPATIIFTADGTEIVKRRGYIAPDVMASLLEAIIEDPSPGPSVVAEEDIVPSQTPLLTNDARGQLVQRSLESFDAENSGWGDVHKFIDSDSMDWELLLAERGDKEAVERARKTFDAALNLIDREAGGLYQYSDEVDWKSPHYEKIMWYQASGLKQYSAAYSLFKEPRYLAAARDIARYLLSELRSPEGAFYTSQDADVDASTPGKTYYGLKLADRERLSRHPRIDRNIYARENGWAVSALASYYAASGDDLALIAAETAARWVLANRTIEVGGFRHGAMDRGGPFLSDTLAMGQAAIDLYAATGKRLWLEVARNAGDYIARHFKDDAGGFKTSLQAEATAGVFAKPAKPLDEQSQVTRFANKLNRYFGSENYRAFAEHGGRYLTSSAILDLPRSLPGVLLVDAELSREPTHITIVGHKDDPRSASLHSAARAYPALDKRIDWWDKREGALPNPDVQYPELDQPAAFACTDRICSLPVFEPAELAQTVSQMLGRTALDAQQR